MAKRVLLLVAIGGVSSAEKCARSRRGVVPERAVWESDERRDVLAATSEEVSASYCGADLLERLMNSSYDRYRVFVFQHRIFVHESLLRVDKSRKFVNMLAHMSERLEDAAWLHDSGARGASIDGLPTTVIARKYSKRGILVPNPYFGKKRGLPKEWDKERRTVVRAAASSSEKRVEKVFWRGGVAHKYSCGRGEGNYARLQAISLTVCFPQYFDVRCQRGCRGNFTFDEQCFNYDQDVGLMALDDKYWPQEHYAAYLFLLNLPGSTSGSYSRNLNHLWAAAGVVLMWQSDYVEWYYPALRHYQTHITVNKSTILNAVESVFADNELRETLQRGARLVDAQIACGDCIVDYVEKVVKMLHQHQCPLLLGTREDEFFIKHNFTEIRAIKGTLKTTAIPAAVGVAATRRK